MFVLHKEVSEGQMSAREMEGNRAVKLSGRELKNDRLRGSLRGHTLYFLYQTAVSHSAEMSEQNSPTQTILLWLCLQFDVLESFSKRKKTFFKKKTMLLGYIKIAPH